MMENSSTFKKIYCVYEGETKSLVTKKSPINDYETLKNRIKEKFQDLKGQEKIRIFYADDEGEVISISY